MPLSPLITIGALRRFCGVYLLVVRGRSGVRQRDTRASQDDRPHRRLKRPCQPAPAGAVSVRLRRIRARPASALPNSSPAAGSGTTSIAARAKSELLGVVAWKITEVTPRLPTAMLA